MLECTTQWALKQLRIPLRQHRKSRFTWLLNQCSDKTASTDDIKGSCHSCDSHSLTEVFYGCKSYTINVHGMTKKGDFPKVYWDFIWEAGIPSVLQRDQAKNEQSEEVMEIHQEFLIKDEYLEADNEVHAIS